MQKQSGFHFACLIVNRNADSDVVGIGKGGKITGAQILTGKDCLNIVLALLRKLIID